MTTKARITTKGQVTIPKEVRDRLGLDTGDEIEFVEEAGSYRLKKLIEDNPFSKWRGYLKHLAGTDVDELIEQMRGR